MKNDSRYPLVLLSLYLVEFLVLGYAPVSRVTWIAENAVALLTVGTLIWLYRRGIQFSNWAYTLAAVFIFFHTIGGHYTFEKVPFGFVTDLFGFERNHFDRMCHFMVGFFAFPAMEFLEKRSWVNGRGPAAFLVIMSLFGFAAIFELVEWIYAELSDPAAGNAFLGSQGDIWDAQKDMLCDGLGAIFSVTLYSLIDAYKKLISSSKHSAA